LAALLLATRFENLDDEGYVLISLARYFQSGHLYRDVYSQYGPVVFLTGEFLFRVLGIPLSHDGGRLVTLVAWTVASLLSARIVYRSTRNLPLAAAACGCFFVVGSNLANEPMHPELIVLALSVAAIYLSFSLRQPWTPFALGAAGALLLLTKVNVGAFYGIALLQTILVMAPEKRLRTLGLWVTAPFAIVLPYLMMRGHVSWSGSFCAEVTACIVSVSVVGSRVRYRARASFPALWLCLAGGAFTAALVVCFTLLRGSSPRDLMNGVILWNLRLPDIFSMPLYPAGFVVLCCILILAASALLCLRIMLAPVARFHDELGALCFAAGLLAAGLSVGRLPFIGLAALPLGFIPIFIRQDLSASAAFGRLFVMNWCALGFLQAWPVAGGQVRIATFPLLIWAFIAMGDGLDGCSRWLGHILEKLVQSAGSLRGLARCSSPGAIARVAAVAATLCAAYAAATGDTKAARLVREYRTYPASRLNGAHYLHLPPDQESTYRFLAASVRRNCDLLFTMPGMASFNLPR
jgi:hypothetical protein